MKKNRSRNSYKIDKFIERDAEALRLTHRACARLNSLIPGLKRVGLRSDMRLLDVGSGPGIRTSKLADFLVNGSVVGIDTSQTLLKNAEELKNKRRLNNIEFWNMDLHSPALASEQFDFAYMRLVLQHLPNPVRSLSKLRASIKPNGIIYLEETDRDWMMIYPEPAGWPALYKKIKSGQKNRGGDPNSGRKLPDILKKSGFEVIHSGVVPVHGTGLIFDDWVKNYAPTFLNNISKRERAAGEEVIESVRRLAKKVPIYFTQLWFQSAGVKR